MDSILKHTFFLRSKKVKGKNELNAKSNPSFVKKDTLAYAELNREYTIEAITTDNDEMRDFLFTLGCYEGEKITLLSILSDQYVIVIKDARYSINKELAKCIAI